MVALCSPVAPLVVAPSRSIVYQAGAPRNTLRHETLRVRRRQVVQRPPQKMIFGLQRMFNWLTPTDIGAAVICTYFVIRRLRMIDDEGDTRVIAFGCRLAWSLRDTQHRPEHRPEA